MSSLLTLGAMFASSFTSATLLPGNSEIVLTALLLAGQVSPWWLVLTAIVGNILGGLTNVIIGRLVPDVKPQRGVQLSLRWLQRYGAVTLLLSWVPIIGDLLCVLAGWLRMPWVPVAFYLSIGKAVRYVALAWLTLQGMSWWS